MGSDTKCLKISPFSTHSTHIHSMIIYFKSHLYSKREAILVMVFKCSSSTYLVGGTGACSLSTINYTPVKLAAKQGVTLLLKSN